jgi:hypothetical protein
MATWKTLHTVTRKQLTYIQGNSREISNTLGNDSVSDSKQKKFI